MTYNTFTAHNKLSSWGCDTGTQVQLFGGFYDYHATKTVRKIKTVTLCEKLPAKDIIKKYGTEHWFIQANKELIAQAIKTIETKNTYEHAQLVIESKNKQINSLFMTTKMSD